jgi:hypothetical protein
MRFANTPDFTFSPPSRSIALGVFLGCAALLLGTTRARADVAKPAPPAYRHTITGCRVWDSFPEAGTAVAWTGACAGGYASGPGTLTWANDGEVTSEYVGTLQAGKLSGEGTFSTPDGLQYHGPFVDDQFEGEGTLILPNGERYLGHFDRGKRSGHGRYLWPAGDSYDGDFVDGQINGTGIKHWAQGDSYSGEWLAGHMSGIGLYTSANGNSLSGQFLHDHPHDGYAAFHWKNGASFTGLIVHGRPNGHGVYVLATGEKYEGVWIQGTLSVGGKTLTVGEPAQPRSR